MGNTVGIISIKGGVGKTTTVANLGSVLAHEFGKKVLIVDANFSAANLGLHLGIVNPESTIQDVLAGKTGILNAVMQHELGFDVIASSVVPKKVNFLALKQHLKKIKNNYDVILLDSSPALNEEILATMTSADELVVLSTPDHPTLSCTMHAVKVAKRRGTPIAGIILNKVHNKHFELSTEEIEEATETPVIAAIPHDVNVLEALAASTPASIHGNLSDVGVEYRKLAGALVGEHYEDKRFKAKVKNWLNSRKMLDPAKHEVNRHLMRENRSK